MPKKNKPSGTPTAKAQPSADAPVLSPAAHTVGELLETENPATAAELAERASLGRSTVTKALAALLAAGLAVRQEGGHEGPRRMPDRWLAAAAADADDPTASGDAAAQPSAADGVSAQAAESVGQSPQDTGSETDSAAAAGADDGQPQNSAMGGDDEAAVQVDDDSEQNSPAAHPVSGPGDQGLTDQDTAETNQATDADTESVTDTDESDSEHAEPDDQNTSSDADVVVPKAAAQDPADPAPSGSRLGKGELRAQVEAHLREHPEQTWTPTAISKVLNRSAGAINNACVTLSETGTVTAFTDRPVRFQWAGDTTAA